MRALQGQNDLDQFYLPSLKLNTASTSLHHPKRKLFWYISIHFQVLAVSFREGKTFWWLDISTFFLKPCVFNPWRVWRELELFSTMPQMYRLVMHCLMKGQKKSNGDEMGRAEHCLHAINQLFLLNKIEMMMINHYRCFSGCMQHRICWYISAVRNFPYVLFFRLQHQGTRFT